MSAHKESIEDVKSLMPVFIIDAILLVMWLLGNISTWFALGISFFVGCLWLWLTKEH